MIEACNLVKRYGAFEAVRGVSFEVNPGEIVGLLGPNGAGKTTIMKILTCYHFPSDGKALLCGINVEDNPIAAKRLVGYLPETAPLYTDLTVNEYLGFASDIRGLRGTHRKERLEYVISECALEKVIYKPIDQLSKGFRQRTGLAQAILHDPEILILDEPTNGLDPNQILEIRALIHKLGEKKTVILSTHILQEVEAMCARVLILNEGKIAAQGTSESISDTMKGEIVFTITLKSDDTKKCEEMLKKIPNLFSIKSCVTKSDYELHATLSMKDTKNAAEDVFDFALEHKYKLLEMTKQRISLEDVFVKLTSEGDK